MAQSFYARRAWPIMIVLARAYPLILLGMLGALESSNNNIHQWLPQGTPARETYESFRAVFGSDDFALVSWVGCTLDDPRLEQFARQIVPPPDQRRPGDGTEWFGRVITGPRAVEILMDEPFNLPRKVAVRRLQGILVGPDRQTTCALITLSKAGDANRTAALAAMKEIAETHCRIDPQELRLGGDAVINAAIDIESERAIDQWILLSWAVALAVAWLCLRSLKLMVMIFVVALYGSQLGTAMVYYTGGTMNLVLVVVPVLLYVLSLSAAVHLSNYYRDALREAGPAGASVRAMAVGWTPCTLSAITTALGLISLYVSQIEPVRRFGLYSALGILLCLGILFLLLPAATEKWPVNQGSGIRGQELEVQSPIPNPQSLYHRGAHNRTLRGLADLTIRHRRPVVLICLAAMIFFAGGVAFVDTTVAPSRFFAEKSKWVRDAHWLQEQLGPMIPIEVVVRFDKQCPLNHLQRMELVQGIEHELRSLDPVGGIVSPATFGPTLGGSMPAVDRATIDSLLRRNLDDYADTGYLYVDHEKELWRISARVPAFSGVSHDKFLDEIESRIDAFIQEYLGEKEVSDPETVQATYTGIVPLVYLAQRKLLSGLFKSFCLAFVMIAVVMMLLLLQNSLPGMLRSVRSFAAGMLRTFAAGMLVMLPNVFPAVVTFGTMGWTKTVIDVGAMMTASVALGIAVDDTLHYLTWFRRALRRGRTRPEAIVEAFERCAPAMTQTTLIAGLGLLVFYRSSFQPVSQFGLLMFVLLLAALVGDLVFLPALLATRWGKLFERTKVSTPAF